VYTTTAFWERLWHTGGIQSLFFFIIAYFVYGHQPQVGASPDALVVFYDGERTQILIAAVFSGLAILNLMWSRRRSGSPWRMPGKTAGARRQPLPAQRWERSSSCSSR
jgi:hypothetical protein